jgi:hypothetical protein
MNAGEDFSLRGKIAATAAAVALTIALGAVDYLVTIAMKFVSILNRLKKRRTI